MTKPERSLNRNLTNAYTEDKPLDFVQVPGAHPRISPLKAAIYGRAAHRVNGSLEPRGGSSGDLHNNSNLGSRQSNMLGENYRVASISVPRR